jgi:hypothetical protein
LRIWSSRTAAGWQWAAHLETLGGESLRFNDPAALLAHLHTLIAGSDGVAALHTGPRSGAEQHERSEGA